LCEIPVIVLSIVDEENMGFALGAADYLTKPIDRARLVSVLERYRRGKNRVLLVEDDPATRDLVRRTLEKQGMQVFDAINGEDGLAQIDEIRPDMVLLDLMMPVMDGFQFLAAMKRRPEWRSIPVIVVTAKELTDDDKHQLEGQVQSVLQKLVYNRQELLSEIKRLLHLSGNLHCTGTHR
jgi:CheY-like chemotaxis protein